MRLVIRKISVLVAILLVLLFTTRCAGPQAFISTSVDVGEAPTQVTDTSVVRIRILTYNIFHGGFGSMNISRIAKVIRSVNPDIVAIQEIDQNRLITGYVNQVAKLGKFIGLTPIFGPEVICWPSGEYGNAIFTRFEVKEHTNHLLHSYLGFKQRRMLEVEMVMDGFHFYVLTVHLSPLDIPSRVLLAKTVEDIVKQKSDVPMILAGDFNAGPNSRTMSIFKQRWGVASKGNNLKTYPSIAPIRQKDYVLFYPQDQWKVVEIKTISEPFISDHLSVLAVLEWIGDRNEAEETITDP